MDLKLLCQEILEWRKTGKLPDDAALRVYADNESFDHHGDDRLRAAEAEVMLDATRMAAQIDVFDRAIETNRRKQAVELLMAQGFVHVERVGWRSPTRHINAGRVMNVMEIYKKQYEITLNNPDDKFSPEFRALEAVLQHLAQEVK